MKLYPGSQVGMSANNFQKQVNCNLARSSMAQSIQTDFLVSFIISANGEY